MTALAIESVEPTAVAVSALKRDPELACRAAGLNKAAVGEYSEVMLTGATFPPIVVFVDSKGVHWLADGFHRCAAAELAGITNLAADLREGSRKDALLFAATANGSHGLRRTNADKRRAVQLVLGNFPKWSDRKVGEACGVDHKTVAAVRAAATPATSGELPQTPGESDGPSATADALIARLRKSLDRIIGEWPGDRRDELRTRLLEVCTAPE